MLTKPYAGWTDFSLAGTNSYSLSYLDDIALEWVEQAIHGLETLLPFCVKGFLEPNRMICTVSYWNCYILIEDDEREPLQAEEIHHEYSHTSMLEFCKLLYQDIQDSIEEWAAFVDYEYTDVDKKKQTLCKKLERLKALIAEKEEYFGANRCFL